MKFTLSWLKDHLDTEAPLDTIADTLTRIGLEVEGVEDQAAALKPFVIARILRPSSTPMPTGCGSARSIPGAGEPVQVVCGAPNARAGLVSVFSPPGTYVPGKDITLSRRARSAASRATACCARAPNSASATIMTASWNCRPTRRSASLMPLYAGLDDPVIEINLTPNRPDCTSRPRHRARPRRRRARHA